MVGGNVKAGDLSAGEVFGKRLAEVRRRRGWTQTELADRLRDAGGVGLGGQEPMHRVRLAKIESDPEKAARVTLEEVLALSYVLGVSPLYMISPIEHAGGPRVCIVGKAGQPADGRELRAWLRGEEALVGQDEIAYAIERSRDDAHAAVSRRGDVFDHLMASYQYPKEDR